MYKRKIPLDLSCGISIASEVIMSKWKYCILSQIEKGFTRPKDMLEPVSGITKRVLHQQLKELEYYRLVEKEVYSEVPLRVEYSLTEIGKSVLPVLRTVNEWGLGFYPKYMEITDSGNQDSR